MEHTSDMSMTCHSCVPPIVDMLTNLYICNRESATDEYTASSMNVAVFREIETEALNFFLLLVSYVNIRHREVSKFFF